MSGARLRDAATTTTIAGVQNHFDLGDPQQRVTTLRRNAAPDTGVVPPSPSARTREKTAAGRSRPPGERHERGRIAA